MIMARNMFMKTVSKYNKFCLKEGIKQFCECIVLLMDVWYNKAKIWHKKCQKKKGYEGL